MIISGVSNVDGYPAITRWGQEIPQLASADTDHYRAVPRNRLDDPQVEEFKVQVPGPKAAWTHPEPLTTAGQVERGSNGSLGACANSANAWQTCWPW
jgi:hypothetical protein